MKNKNRGFTLIELLVVVAIIGILASVGVVAYNGYTESAKKAGVASNHANIMKTIGAELAKCNIDSKTFVASTGSLDCSKKTESGVVATAAAAYITDKTAQYKNPYSGAVINDAASGVGAGQTSIEDDGSMVTIKSCKSKDDCVGTTDAESGDTTESEELLSGSVSIN